MYARRFVEMATQLDVHVHVAISALGRRLLHEESVIEPNQRGDAWRLSNRACHHLQREGFWCADRVRLLSPCGDVALAVFEQHVSGTCGGYHYESRPTGCQRYTEGASASRIGMQRSAVDPDRFDEHAEPHRRGRDRLSALPRILSPSKDPRGSGRFRCRPYVRSLRRVVPSCNPLERSFEGAKHGCRAGCFRTLNDVFIARCRSLKHIPSLPFKA